MRKILSAVGAAAVAIAVVGAGFQASSSASTAGRTLRFSTKLYSFTPIDVAPTGHSAGDGFVVAGHIIRNGARDGISTAQCTFTAVSNPAVTICEVDYALSRGLITTRAVSTGPGLEVVVTGGNGIYTGVQGYGAITPTKTGTDVVLHLLG
jgi:hypothetical protein